LSFAWECTDKSVPFGKYCLSNRLVFSFEPRCHGPQATAAQQVKNGRVSPAFLLSQMNRKSVSNESRVYIYLQKNAFGGKVSGQSFGTATTSPPRLNLLRLEEDLSQAHLRLSQTYIEHLDWADCIAKYDREHTLFYCDPPYWGTEGYGVDFGIDQYTRMAELARTIKGKMVISVNDIPEMRKAFTGLHMESVSITYTVSGKNRAAKTAELVIRNW